MRERETRHSDERGDTDRRTGLGLRQSLGSVKNSDRRGTLMSQEDLFYWIPGSQEDLTENVCWV